MLENEITAQGPSVAEGRRTFRAKDGGWRVAQGEGPLGTDLLRFYIEVEEQIARGGEGGDVYLPRGRVYASCGHFPFLDVDGEMVRRAKETLQNELQRAGERLLEVQRKKDQLANPFSLEAMRLSQEIFKLSQEAKRRQNELNLASVKEPDQSLLRFSRKGDVGLTKEGGLCCEVTKGIVTQYHILGRFSIAAMDHEA